MILRRVLFPQPEGPMMAVKCCLGKETETSARRGAASGSLLIWSETLWRSSMEVG